MKLYRYLSLAVIGGFAGFLLTGSPDSPAQAATPPAGAAPVPARAAEPSRVWQVTDFEALLAQARERNGDVLTDNPLHEELSHWSIEELRAALQALVSQPGFFLPASKFSGVMRHLINEWMNRDLDGFLAWYDGLKSEKARSTMAMTMSYLWPKDRAEDGLQYLLSHPEFKGVNGGSGSWKILKNALANSALRGPGAAAEFLTMVRQNGLVLDGGPVEFPPGFDFATLMKTDAAQALWKADNAAGLIGGWMKQDRDGAFDALTTHIAENPGSRSTPLFDQEMNGKPEAYVEKMSWLAKRLNDLDPEQRGTLIDQGFTRIVYSPDALKAFADGLTDPADQHLIQGRAVEAIRTIGAEAALSYLEAMGDPAERVEFLQTFTPAPAMRGAPPATVSEELIRSRLAEWKATPDEIENIVKRLNDK